MREYEEVEQLEKRRVLKNLTCDMCGKEGSEGGWKSSKWNMNETELEVRVRQTEGTNYPEGGWGTEYVIDMCPSCFKNRLIPWLKSEGVKIEEKEWDW